MCLVVHIWQNKTTDHLSLPSSVNFNVNIIFFKSSIHSNRFFEAALLKCEDSLCNQPSHLLRNKKKKKNEKKSKKTVKNSNRLLSAAVALRSHLWWTERQTLSKPIVIGNKFEPTEPVLYNVSEWHFIIHVPERRHLAFTQWSSHHHEHEQQT